MTVTRLGALCDHTGESDDGGLEFTISEWLEVDGRRVTLHDGFGFTSVLSGDDDPWQYLTAEALTSTVLTVVLPEDDDPDDAGEEHPWTWLAELAAEHGITVTPEELKAVPYAVELTPRCASAPGGTP